MYKDLPSTISENKVYNVNTNNTPVKSYEAVGKNDIASLILTANSDERPESCRYTRFMWRKPID